MQIDRIYYPAQTLGYGKRIVIWTIGCPHRCYHCSNPELWEENPDRDIEADDMIQAIKPYLSDADGITITGGDPFWQKNSLIILLEKLRNHFTGDILVFSGYTLEEIKADPVMSQCLPYIDVLVDGRYDEEKNDNMGLRGSNNQSIHRLNPSFANRYSGAESWQRSSQVVVCNNNIISVGIPVINRDETEAYNN